MRRRFADAWPIRCGFLFCITECVGCLRHGVRRECEQLIGQFESPSFLLDRIPIRILDWRGLRRRLGFESRDSIVSLPFEKLFQPKASIAVLRSRRIADLQSAVNAINASGCPASERHLQMELMASSNATSGSGT